MKLQDDTAYIQSLIAEGEHVRQDFKYEISDSRKIARTLSAFSNTQGGRLLIGVKDNGRIAGVRSEEEIYMVEAAARLYCSPEVEVTAEAYTAEGKTVLLARIPPATAKPVMARDEDNRLWAYVRIADENILATAVHMGVWRCANEAIPPVFAYTERERLLLGLLAGGNAVGIAKICRHLHEPRRRVVALLARLIHWGLVEIVHDAGGFAYKAADCDLP